MANHIRKFYHAVVSEWASSNRPIPLNNCTLMEVGGGHWSIAETKPTGRRAQDLARFRTEALPGCSTVVVTSGVWLAKQHRGQGLGKFLRDLRERAYRAAGFHTELCTVRTDNEAQNAIMARRGRVVAEYPSDHGGLVRMWLTDLRDALLVIPEGVEE